jgi:RNA polymerase sigma factor (sigma-70 family)
MNQAIIKWIKIVVMRTLKEKNLTRLDVKTLISAGMFGYSQALSRFDPKRNVKFKTFAEYRIKGAVLDEVRKMIGDERAKNPRPRIITDFDYSLIGDGGDAEKHLESSLDFDVFMDNVPLSHQEIAVLQCRIEGMNIREIAKKFSFSESRASQILASIKHEVFAWYKDTLAINMRLINHECPVCRGVNCVANHCIKFKCEFCDTPIRVCDGSPLMDDLGETYDDSEIRTD